MLCVRELLVSGEQASYGVLSSSDDVDAGVFFSQVACVGGGAADERFDACPSVGQIRWTAGIGARRGPLWISLITDGLLCLTEDVLMKDDISAVVLSDPFPNPWIEGHTYGLLWAVIRKARKTDSEGSR